MRQSYTSGMPAWCGTLRPVDALPCGSRSTTSTRLPCSANATARFTVVGVLPTPPFWFATQRTLGWSGRGIVISPLGLRICTARNASMASGGSSSSRPGVSRETCSAGLGSVPSVRSDVGEETGADTGADPDTGTTDGSVRGAGAERRGSTDGDGDWAPSVVMGPPGPVVDEGTLGIGRPKTTPRASCAG